MTLERRSQTNPEPTGLSCSLLEWQSRVQLSQAFCYNAVLKAVTMDTWCYVESRYSRIHPFTLRQDHSMASDILVLAVQSQLSRQPPSLGSLRAAGMCSHTHSYTLKQCSRQMYSFSFRKTRGSKDRLCEATDELEMCLSRGVAHRLLLPPLLLCSSLHPSSLLDAERTGPAGGTCPF